MDASLNTDFDDGAAVGRELSDGQRVLPIILVRRDGTVRAYLNSCPHAGVRLDWRPDDFFDYTGQYLLCAMHGALFEPTTGYCLAGPCRGTRLICLGSAAADAGKIVVSEVEKIPSTAIFRR